MATFLGDFQTLPRVNAAGASDRDAVLDADAFVQTLAHFIDTAVAKAQPRNVDAAFADAYRALLEARAQTNSRIVDAFQTASIEQILLRWLLLGAIKWDPLGIVFEPFGGDTDAVMRARRAAYAQCVDSAGNACVGDAPAPDDALFARGLAFRRRHFDGARTVHVSLQPLTTEFAVNGQPFRTDLYFWSPADAHFALVAECAGFQPHAAPHATAVALPVDVLAMRLTGIDVFRDPVGAVLQLLHAAHHELVDPAASAGGAVAVAPSGCV